jgi:hypothetical protein
MDVLIIGLAAYLTLSLLATIVVMGAVVAGSRSDVVLHEGAPPAHGLLDARKLAPRLPDVESASG